MQIVASSALIAREATRSGSRDDVESRSSGIRAALMTKKHEKDEANGAEEARDTPRRRGARQNDWDDAKTVINIEYSKPGTALDDHLRKEQTRALLDLLADYERKLDKNGDAGP